jgi:hypothetical protein
VSALKRQPEGGELRARCDAYSGEWYVTETVHGPYGVDHWTLAEGFLTRADAWAWIEAKEEAACNG